MATVILFSDLVGSFADREGSCSACRESYLQLKKAGVELVFVTGMPPDMAREILTGLDPDAAVIAGGGEILIVPKGHALGAGGDLSECLNQELPTQQAAVEHVIGRFRSLGNIVIPFGIGDSADDTFLRAVEVAALIHSSNGDVCPLVPRPEVVYVCRQPEQEGWNEWADLMLRRVEIISMRD